jgi:hypothetical protein
MSEVRWELVCLIAFAPFLFFGAISVLDDFIGWLKGDDK